MSARPVSTVGTYTLAHTAQCKLKLAANRPDRNLRFVLGHAFTLDNLMLRIVEIENKGAKSAFEEGQKVASGHGGEHFDCTKAAPEPEPEHFDCTQAQPTQPEPEPPVRGRRISFQDNGARPSSTAGVGSNNGGNSPARRRSPPPVALPSTHNYLDEDGSEDTSSDDYDEPDEYLYSGGAAATESKVTKKRPEHDAYSDDEASALELADDELDDPLEDDMNSLSLTRFESASAHPPRMVRSDSSSSEEDDGPVSPPQLPADVDVHELMAGEKDDELTDLFESVRRCACHGHRDNVGGEPQGIWDVPSEKAGGRRLAVVAVAA